MNDFLLTLLFCWVYARYAIAKSMDGFSSLLRKRMPPLSGFFVSVIYLPFCFGWIFWGAERLAGLTSGLLTRFIRPPRVPHGWRFSRNRSNKEHES
jgi:hypothetical protein